MEKMKHCLFKFENNTERTNFENGESYKEPYVSKVTNDNSVHYNTANNGYEFKDLGLPSGTLWSTMNVGADFDYVLGKQFAWGELEEKNEYTEQNYKFYVSGEEEYSKYNSTDNVKKLQLEDDAARENMSGKWQIPTIEQFAELFDSANTEHMTAMTPSGETTVVGMAFISKHNDNAIVFPICESGGEGSIDLWAKDLSDNKKLADSINITTEEINEGSFNRYYGLYIRPVINNK